MPHKDKNPLFQNVTIIGIGLIGASLAYELRAHDMAVHITIADINDAHCQEAIALGLGDHATTNIADAVADADLIVIATPVGAFATIGQIIQNHLKTGAIVTDVGSVKQSVIKDFSPYIPEHAHFVPAHPISGAEKSGPSAGFLGLFENRWTIITPDDQTDKDAVAKIKTMWETTGAHVDEMTAEHHDKVFAITSHLPHLIAYSIVGTADDMERHLKSEVIKYSAGGFRDFTRLAASNPVMWRDIFLSNKESVLEVLQRFTEDLIALQRAIRWDDGDALETLFSRTAKIRRSIIDQQQHKFIKPKQETTSQTHSADEGETDAHTKTA